MRIQTVAGNFVGAIVMLALDAPAAAQGTKVDFSGGYQFIRFLEDEGTNIPKGWGASIAGGNDRIKAVGDIGGHYFTEEGLNVHTFQGGVEFSGKQARVVPFGRVLAGLAYFTESEENSLNAFVFTPEGGVKIFANDRVGVQASLGFPVMHIQGSTETTMRFFVGVAIRK